MTMDVPPGYRLTTQWIIEGIASPGDYGPVDLNTVHGFDLLSSPVRLLPTNLTSNFVEC